MYYTGLCFWNYYYAYHICVRTIFYLHRCMYILHLRHCTFRLFTLLMFIVYITFGKWSSCLFLVILTVCHCHILANSPGIWYYIFCVKINLLSRTLSLKFSFIHVLASNYCVFASFQLELYSDTFLLQFTI